MNSFAQPLLLLLLGALPIVAWAIFRRHPVTAIFAPLSRRLPKNGATYRTRLLQCTPYLYIIGAGLLIFSAAGPQYVETRQNKKLKSIAIEMVVDVSGSMRGLDLSPSRNELRTRLDVVKETFAQFVKASPDDLIGLITFAGYPATRVPLTADHDALLHVLEGVKMPDEEAESNETTLVSREENMTAIGDGLATAIARLEHAEPKNKIVILLTDGENNFGAIPPLEAATIAKKMGIRVYTIGVGTTGIVPYWTGAGVARVMLSIDESTLKTIADMTGGRYANVTSRQALEDAFKEIATLEKSDINHFVWEQATPRYHTWLTLGAGAILLSCMISLALRRELI